MKIEQQITELGETLITYSHKLAFQIIEKEEEFLMTCMIADIQEHPEKYPIDELKYITREKLFEIIKLGFRAYRQVHNEEI